MPTENSCSGIGLRGYWKGYPCGAVPKFEHNGKHYCHSHYAVAVNDPERFERVAAQVERSAQRKKKNEEL